MIKQTHKHTKSLSSSTQPLFITQNQQHQQQQQQKEGELLWLGSINCIKMSSRQREQVGDFYVHLVNNDVAADHQEGAGSRRRRGRQQPQLVVDKNLTSSTKLLAYNDKLPGSNGIKKPTVLHFYDGG